MNRSRQQASGWAAEALKQLHETLLAERDALIREDFDGLSQAVLSKEQTLRRLAARLTPADAITLQQSLRPLRELNEGNARLLAPRLRLNQARIETLLGATRTSALYSASGRAAGAENLRQRSVRA